MMWLLALLAVLVGSFVGARVGRRAGKEEAVQLVREWKRSHCTDALTGERGVGVRGVWYWTAEQLELYIQGGVVDDSSSWPKLG